MRRAITFSEVERCDVVESLHLDSHSREAIRLIKKVEAIVSDAVELRLSVERGPKAATCALLLKQVLDAAASLRQALFDLDQSTLLRLQDELGSDYPLVDDNDELVVPDVIVALADSQSLLLELRSVPRQRRPAEDARDQAVRELLTLGRAALKVPTGQFPSSLLDYISAALHPARLPFPERPEKMRVLLKRLEQATRLPSRKE